MIASQTIEIHSLEDWMANPVDDTEWVDGELVEIDGMTLKHAKVQGNLCFHWRSYLISSKCGGDVYVEVPCRTKRRGRRPDVAYLTSSLVEQYGNAKALPQSFPLVAEIISPTDLAEAIITKAQEYLQSGSEEVWLVFPENHWVIVATQTVRKIYSSGETITTEVVLPGFSISVDELMA